MSDLASISRLVAPALRTRLVGGRLVVLDEVASTNDYALDPEEYRRRDGAVFVADRQCAGRGRHGNAWHSAPGLGLWFSVALKGPGRGLVFAAALAVRDAIAAGMRPDAAAHTMVEIKWPNDVLCNGRKVCGILVEERDGWSALGVGLNVHHSLADFPAVIRHAAGSLESVTGHPWDRVRLLRGVLERLDTRVLELRGGGYEAMRCEWLKHCRIVGRVVRCGTGFGRVVAADADGALLIQGPGGRQRMLAGELEILDGA